MFFGWLKRYMPRGLYGRAALILLVPIVVIQLVTSVVFIQRHFEDVTRQMTSGLAAEAKLIAHTVEAAGNVEAALRDVTPLADELGIGVALPAVPREGDVRRWYDLSGRVLIEELRTRLSGVASVDLRSQSGKVHAQMETRFGPMELVFPRNRATASNPHQLLVLMVFTAILMTLISYVFLRNQLRPIQRLARAAEAFGRGRVEPYRPQGALEVRSAGTAFLDMRNRIERQIEQRTMMLSGVSHDLRTPLTRMKLSLSMMDEGDGDVEGMRRDVADMERLLDEFLTFAKGDALDDPVAVDPLALFDGVVERARRSGGDVSVHVRPAQAQPVKLRPVAVERALENLVGNALRYGKRAEVSLELFDKSVRFRVEDDGPGIPEDKRDVAVQPFSRLDQARNQNRGTGVGLGLAIATDVARRHGGTLRLGQSTRLGGLCADLVLAV